MLIASVITWNIFIHRKKDGFGNKIHKNHLKEEVKKFLKTNYKKSKNVPKCNSSKILKNFSNFF